MTLVLPVTRKARLEAGIALLLACVWMPAAGGQQASKGNAATTKAAPEKTSTQKPASPATTAKSPSTTHAATATHHSSRRRRSPRVRGQKKIDPERVRTIQEALIHEHYLKGEATGTWNQASEDAMRCYQGDHGWQTKEVPDSRALISLGLGPSKDHLLNPESAMTSGPEPEPAAAATSAPKLPTTPAANPTPNPVDPANPQ